MPRGRSSFSKRQKEQLRQQRQRDKVERRTQRKQDTPEAATLNDDELHENAKAQAALFQMDSDEPTTAGSNFSDESK